MSAAITAAAGERSAVSRCCAFSTKTRLSLVADCRLETRVTGIDESPTSRQPRLAARSPEVCFMASYCRFPGRVCTTRRWSPSCARLGRARRPSPHKPRPHTSRPSSIQRWLAWWARLPAAVDPEPLVGILPDDVFDYFREFCGVSRDVCFVIGGADQLDGGTKAQDVFAQCLIPNGKAGDDSGVGAQRNSRQATGGAGWDTEEIDEHPLRRSHVGIHKDADSFAVAHGREQSAHEIVLVDGAVAVHGAVTLQKSIDVRIVQRAHDDRQRVPLE